MGVTTRSDSYEAGSRLDTATEAGASNPRMNESAPAYVSANIAVV